MAHGAWSIEPERNRKDSTPVGFPEPTPVPSSGATGQAGQALQGVGPSGIAWLRWLRFCANGKANDPNDRCSPGQLSFHGVNIPPSFTDERNLPNVNKTTRIEHGA